MPIGALREVSLPETSVQRIIKYESSMNLRSMSLLLPISRQHTLDGLLLLIPFMMSNCTWKMNTVVDRKRLEYLRQDVFCSMN